MTGALINCSANLVRGNCRCHALPPRRSFGSLVVRINGNRLRQSHQVRQASRQPRCRQVLQVSAAVAEAPAAATAMSADGFEISQQSISESRRRVVITAPPKACKKAWQRMIKQARKDLKPPGFRDLKSVSEAVLMPYLGGELGAKAAAVEALVKNLPKEVSALTADAISESIAPDELTDDSVKGFDVEKPFTYAIAFDLQPKLRWKQPYKGLKVEVQSVGNEKTDQARVEQELLQVRKKKGGLKVVQGRGLQKGDAALVDFDAKKKATGEVFQGAKRRKTHMDTDSADMQFLPGVAEAMVGMKVGESREISITLPDNFEPASLRGEEITCTVGVTELFEYDLPELDDQLAEEVAPNSGGVQGLQQQLLRMQTAKTAQDNREAVDEAIMAAVVNLIDCEVPKSMVDEMAKSEYQARLLQAQAKGEIDYEKVMQLATPQSLENFTRRNYEELAQLLRRQMAFEHIFAAEGLTVSDAEIEEEYDSAAREFTEQQQQFDQDKLREQVVEALKGPKILDWLRQHTEVVVKPVQA